MTSVPDCVLPNMQNLVHFQLSVKFFCVLGSCSVVAKMTYAQFTPYVPNQDISKINVLTIVVPCIVYKASLISTLWRELQQEGHMTFKLQT